MRRAAVLTAAGLALLVAPARAASVSADGCANTGAPITVVASGFAPLTPVRIELTTGPSTRTVESDASGTARARLRTGASPGRFAASATDGTASDSAPVRVIGPEIDATPLSGGLGAKLRLSGEGFDPGKRLWAHVRASGRTLWHRRLNVASGACGTLDARLRPFVDREGGRQRTVPDGKVNVVVNHSRRSFRKRPAGRFVYAVGGRGLGGRGFTLVSSPFLERG